MDVFAYSILLLKLFLLANGDQPTGQGHVLLKKPWNGAAFSAVEAECGIDLVVINGDKFDVQTSGNVSYILHSSGVLELFYNAKLARINWDTIKVTVTAKQHSLRYATSRVLCSRSFSDSIHIAGPSTTNNTWCGNEFATVMAKGSMDVIIRKGEKFDVVANNTFAFQSSDRLLTLYHQDVPVKVIVTVPQHSIHLLSSSNGARIANEGSVFNTITLDVRVDNCPKDMHCLKLTDITSRTLELIRLSTQGVVSLSGYVGHLEDRRLDKNLSVLDKSRLVIGDSGVAALIPNAQKST